MFNWLFSKIQKLAPERWRWIFDHAGFRRYSKNTSWLFFGQIFSLLISFFIGVWLARYLGPEQYGIASYVVAFVGLFSFIAYLGVDGILSRELVSHPESRDTLLGTSFRLKLIGGLLAFVTASLATFLIKTDPFIRGLIFLYASSFIFQSVNVVSIFFQARVEAHFSVKAQLAAAIISAFFKIILIVFGLNLVWLILIYVVDVIVQGLALLFAYQASGRTHRAWRFDNKLAKEIRQGAWPLMLSSAAAFVYLRIDQVMVGKMMGETAVGIYAAGVKVTEVFYFLPGIICGSLFPAIVNARKISLDLYYRRLKNFYILLGSLGLAVAIPVVILAKPLIAIIFGAEYLSAVPVLQIYIWSSPGLFLGAAVVQQLMTENRTKTIFMINFAAMVVNVVLNLIFIPKFGLTGAALSTLVAYFVAPVAILFIHKSSRN